MTLRDYLRVFRRRWLIILASVLVAGGVTWLVTPEYDDTRRPTGYTATAVLLVESAPAAEPPRGSTVRPVQQGANLSRVALFVTAGDIPANVADALAYTGNPAVLASSIEVTPDSSAGSLTISATSSDPERAAAIANGFADETVSYYEGGRDGAVVTILQRATPIAQTTSGGFVVPPGKLPRALIAGALGLLFGAALALIMDHLDSRLRSRDQVGEGLHMPVVAEVPKLSRLKKEDGLRVVAEPLDPFADAYRSARSAITHLPSLGVEGAAGVRDGHPSWGGANVVLVTSGFAGEGKTTSVANLAASFAETGKSVLVVDGDLRKPDTHEMLDVPPGAGVSDYLADPEGMPLVSLMRPTSVPGVRMITAGGRLDAPTALVSRMGPLLDAVRSEADVVIVDSSPMLAASDVYDLLPLVDTVLVVVRSGRLTEAAGTRMAELLGRFQVPVTGAMLICAPAGSDGYGNGYGYGYGYGYGAGKRGKSTSKGRRSKTVDAASREGEQRPSRAR